MSLDGAAIHAAIAAASPDDPFSGVVRVQEGDTVVFQKGYGLANRADAIPNTSSTRFGMASGCKIFTAVAVLQLVQAGKLALETRLSACLDVDFPHFDPDVTVLHLLTHTSGVPDYCDEELGDDFEALWLERPSYRMRIPARLPAAVPEPRDEVPARRALQLQQRGLHPAGPDRGTGDGPALHRPDHRAHPAPGGHDRQRLLSAG